MAQTPISATAFYNSLTPTTIYTVPAGKTAVVKGVLGASLITTFDTINVNKVTGGITQPLVKNQTSGYITQSSQYYSLQGVSSVNLLPMPITLSAGESISVSSSGTSAYKAETVINNSNYKIANIVHLNGNYIAVGRDNGTGTGLILTSTDGITYTRRTFNTGVTITNAVFGNGYYVVCNSTGGTVHHSTDLVTWTQATLPTTFACYTIAFGNNTFITGGASGRSYYATATPLSWTAATVFKSSDTINEIASIGTNYFYGTSGISYFTSDFTNFTQPYVALASGTNQPTGTGLAVSNNKILYTNSAAPAGAQNTFLRTSTDGALWSYQNTVTNNLSNYSGQPFYAANGGYYIQQYTTQSPANGRYLASSDGVTWTQQDPTFLTGYSNTGTKFFVPAWKNTSDANYANKILIYQAAGGSHYIQGCDISSSGVFNGNNFSFTSTTIPNGSWQGFLMFAGNPNDGSWRASAYYQDGGTYSSPFYYGSSPSNGSDGQRSAGFYNSGQGFSYGTAIGVFPASNRYYGGTEGGWVFTSTDYSSGWGGYIGSPSYVTNPPGINWGLFGGTSVAGFARSGDAANSIVVILWANGVYATSTNQGASWTQGSVGASSFVTMQNGYGNSPIHYGNGRFVAANNVGLIITSTDGINWTTMPSSIESIYYLNSQNVFLGTSSLQTSATGIVDVFSPKTNPTGNQSNPSVNRMVFANSIYYLMDASARMFTSSDLISWTDKYYNTTQINDTTFIGISGMGLAYSGTGSNIVPSASERNPTVGQIGKAFNPANNIYIGTATASIVQID